MYDLEPEVAEQFFCRDPAVNNARQMTVRPACVAFGDLA